MNSPGIITGKTEFFIELKSVAIWSPLRHESERNCPAASSSLPRGRSAGFTLLELLIVLVILTSILAVVWPQMRRRIARSQLKQVAIELTEELAEARQLAINRGESFVLHFQVDGSRYEMGPYSAISQMETGPAGKESASTQRQIQRFEIRQIDVGRLKNNRSLDSVQTERASRGSQMPGFQVVVKDLDPSLFLMVDHGNIGQDRANLPRQELIETIRVGAGANADSQEKYRSIVFSPDGRSTDFEFAVCDARYRIGITVRIRGFTGLASVGDFFVFNRGAGTATERQSDRLDFDEDLSLELEDGS